LQYLVNSEFEFPNTIDCELYKEDSPFLKLFKKKEKRNDDTGINKVGKSDEDNSTSSSKKKKRKGWLKNIFGGK